MSMKKLGGELLDREVNKTINHTSIVKSILPCCLCSDELHIALVIA